LVVRGCSVRSCFLQSSWRSRIKGQQHRLRSPAVLRLRCKILTLETVRRISRQLAIHRRDIRSKARRRRGRRAIRNIPLQIRDIHNIHRDIHSIHRDIHSIRKGIRKTHRGIRSTPRDIRKIRRDIRKIRRDTHSIRKPIHPPRQQRCQRYLPLRRRPPPIRARA
jgi:septal ring factor EnvC (AmiA/AmiB activator)